MQESSWYTGFTPILILLIVVGIVFSRLKRPEGLVHLADAAFRRRRVLNWMLLGFGYAFLYWGRYNLQPAIEALGGKSMIKDFNMIFTAGTWVYGFSFLVNGPLTDRKGGRFAIILSTVGAGLSNLLMGLACWASLSKMISPEVFYWCLLILYPVNMYFQSFGAVAIVKVNSHWFHVKERGVFGAIFGILISLGIYFAFDWSNAIVKAQSAQWAFFAPSFMLILASVLCLIWVKDDPQSAGYGKIETGDATDGDTSPRLPAMQVFRMMLSNPIIMTIAAIEFCSGFLRQSIMQMYRFFAKATDPLLHLKGDFVYENWGLCLCVAGILGGVFAGVLSDRLFQSRRGPVAVLLYGFMVVGGLGMFYLLDHPGVGWIALFMSLSVIGVHGMLSGTASQDFGGSKNVGVAVGIIDGFVYLGTGAQSLFYGFTLPSGEGQEALDLSRWSAWPGAMVVMAVLGLALAFTIRKAKPRPKPVFAVAAK